MARPVDEWRSDADAYLAVAGEFRLGELSTEKPHPLTRDLSRLAREDLPQALSILHTLDSQAIETLCDRLSLIYTMADAVHRTLQAGNRVFV